jgi:hypothetical protein
MACNCAVLALERLLDWIFAAIRTDQYSRSKFFAKIAFAELYFATGIG